MKKSLFTLYLLVITFVGDIQSKPHPGPVIATPATTPLQPAHTKRTPSTRPTSRAVASQEATPATIANPPTHTKPTAPARPTSPAAASVNDIPAVTPLTEIPLQIEAVVHAQKNAFKSVSHQTANHTPTTISPNITETAEKFMAVPHTKKKNILNRIQTEYSTLHGQSNAVRSKNPLIKYGAKIAKGFKAIHQAIWGKSKPTADEYNETLNPSEKSSSNSFPSE